MRARATLSPVVVVVVAATLLTLLGGFWIKDRCTTHHWDGYQYRSSCYNDILALYSFRGLGDRFPYVSGDGDGDPPPGERFDLDGDLEYPVGTGLFVGAIAAMVDDGQSFFRLNALFLAMAALLGTGLLLLMVEDRRRVLFFALGTPLLLYAFHNWDLLAVTLMIGALLAYRETADRSAGLLIGVGAATKLFPGALLPGMVLSRWRERGAAPVAMIVWAAIGFLTLNLPILLINPPGWLFPWRFQSTRFPNFETSWFMIFEHASGGSATADSFWWRTYPELTGYLSGALFVTGLGLLMYAESKRERARPYALAFGAMLIFLLTAKVYSPQFALWLLPFFALVRIPWYGFAAFIVTDAAVWFSISAWFLSQPLVSAGDPDLRFLLLEIAVWTRYAALLFLLWLSRRADENVIAPDARAPAGVPSIA